jgi:hypothetical protein
VPLPFALPNAGAAVLPRINPKSQTSKKGDAKEITKKPKLALPTLGLERLPPKLINLADPLNLKRNA